MNRSESIFSHYWRAYVSGGVLSITRLAVGFVRIKYIAVVLGTAGVGFLSQATQLQLLGISIASLSMATGVINRMGAIGPDNRPRERQLLATAFTAELTVSLLVLFLGIVLLRPLVDMLFGGDAFVNTPLSPLDVLAVLFSVPLSVIASGYLEAIFFGAGRYDLYVRASVWATILGFLATITIIAIWGLPGAFWSFFAASALLLGSFLLYIGRVRPIKDLFHFGFSGPEANALVRFSIAIFVSGALVPAARLWVQRQVISSFGIEANGLLQVPFAVNAYYTPFLTNALWGRMHPAITRLGASPEARRELTAAVRITVVMATAAIVSILFLKDLLVPLAYSRAFRPATPLLPLQLFGDFFYFTALPFTVYALGISRLRVYLAAWVSYAIVAAAASLAFIPLFGLYGVPAGYGLANAIGAVVALAWLISRKDESLFGTLAMIGTGLLIVSAEAFLAWRGLSRVLQGIIVAITGVAALLWLFKVRKPTRA